MAKRNGKRRLRRPMAAHIDLVHWLRLRGYADTAGAARKMLEEGRVRSGANPVGRMQVKVQRGQMETVEYVASPLIDASLRNTLYVVGD